MRPITQLKPLADDLIKIGMSDFLENNEFIRVVTRLEIINHYTEAYNEAVEDGNKNYSFLAIDSISYNDMLIGLMGKLYQDEALDFPKIMISLLEAYFPNSYYLSSIDDVRKDLLLLDASTEQLQRLDKAWERENNNLNKKIMVLKEITISKAVGGSINEEYYQSLRSALLKEKSLAPHIPEFIKDNENTYQYWQFIKYKFGTYQERRAYLEDRYKALSEAVSKMKNPAPHHEHVANIADQINEEFIADTWRKALGRMKDDPEAAITTSRSLIEMVCKHILDESEIAYDDALDLPKLYKLTAATINLSPDQHTEQLFKQILGGCQTVVEGLGGLRNKLGDAHGAGKNKARPAERHAMLAVNLSGSMCSFLLQTFNYFQKNQIS